MVENLNLKGHKCAKGGRKQIAFGRLHLNTDKSNCILPDKTHKDRRRLRAGGGAFRRQGGLGHALNNAAATGSLHRRNGIFGNLKGVVIRKYIGVLAHADIITLV